MGTVMNGADDEGIVGREQAYWPAFTKALDASLPPRSGAQKVWNQARRLLIREAGESKGELLLGITVSSKQMQKVLDPYMIFRCDSVQVAERVLMLTWPERDGQMVLNGISKAHGCLRRERRDGRARQVRSDVGTRT